MTVQRIHQAFVFSALQGGQSVQNHYSVLDNYEVLLGVWEESKNS